VERKPGRIYGILRAWGYATPVVFCGCASEEASYR